MWGLKEHRGLIALGLDVDKDNFTPCEVLCAVLCVQDFSLPHGAQGT